MEATFNFGKYRGRTLRDVVGEDPEYVQWMASSDFTPEVKAIARGALNGEFPLKA